MKGQEMEESAINEKEVEVSEKTGTKEWAETTLNIARGCPHGCRYCYARNMLVDRFKTIKPEDWPVIRINQKVVDAGRGKCQGTVMIPSTHDITPEILDGFMKVLSKLVKAGNNVLIVSKPHWECITKICEGFKDYRDQIMFRFTIGSMDDDILSFWEPGAPNFCERLSCLEYAYHAGFKTSVSCEPYLDPYVVYTYTACKDFITDSFWIGKLRGFNSRVKLDDATPEQIEKFVEPLKAAMSDSVVKGIFRILDGQPFVQWKDSIREVIG